MPSPGSAPRRGVFSDASSRTQTRSQHPDQLCPQLLSLQGSGSSLQPRLPRRSRIPSPRASLQEKHRSFPHPELSPLRAGAAAIPHVRPAARVGEMLGSAARSRTPPASNHRASFGDREVSRRSPPASLGFRAAPSPIMAQMPAAAGGSGSAEVGAMTQEIMRQIRRRRGAESGRGGEAAASFRPTPAPPLLSTAAGVRAHAPPAALTHPGGTAAPGRGDNFSPPRVHPSPWVPRQGGEREAELRLGHHRDDASGVHPAPPHHPPLGLWPLCRPAASPRTGHPGFQLCLSPAGLRGLPNPPVPRLPTGKQPLLSGETEARRHQARPRLLVVTEPEKEARSPGSCLHLHPKLIYEVVFPHSAVPVTGGVASAFSGPGHWRLPLHPAAEEGSFCC